MTGVSKGNVARYGTAALAGFLAGLVASGYVVAPGFARTVDAFALAGLAVAAFAVAAAWLFVAGSRWMREDVDRRVAEMDARWPKPPRG